MHIQMMGILMHNFFLSLPLPLSFWYTMLLHIDATKMKKKSKEKFINIFNIKQKK